MGKSFRRNNDHGRKYEGQRKSRNVKDREKNRGNGSHRDFTDPYENDSVHGRAANY